MSFGKSFTHGVSVQEGWHVPAGQMGRIVSYCDAYEHYGTWIDCGGEDRPGSWYEPRDDRCREKEINIA